LLRHRSSPVSDRDPLFPGLRYNLYKSRVCLLPSCRRAWRKEMSHSRTVQRSVTPDSVKALMIIEAIIIAFFSFWLANEYVYNVYFRVYVNSVFVEHFTTYTIALGLGIGLAGTAAAAALYKNLREAKVKLESVTPRIRGSIEKMLANVPSIEGKPAVPSISPVSSSQSAPEAPGAALVSVPTASTPPAPEEKK